MLRCLIIALFLVALPIAAPAGDDAGTRILVTFSDPGMNNATRAGPAGPGYRRRSSTYLTSVSVKRTANRIARDFNLMTLDEWPIPSLKVHCLVFGVRKDVAIEDLLNRLRARPEVESAQLMNEFEVSGAGGIARDDPYANLQHNLRTLGIAQAHIWSVGAGTNVTIIDTGADLEHPELKSRIVSHHDFVDRDSGVFSDDPHGTAMAGVIGAASNNGVGMMGVAPATQMSVLKACWHVRSHAPAICNSFTLAKALGHAIESDTDVINLSLTGPSDALLGRLVTEALNRGIIVIAAAPKTSLQGFPADVSGVIVVDSDRDTGVSPSRYVLNAPGEDILVPVPRGGYDYASGSSLSAAHVSGIVALLVAVRPGLTRDQINALLVDSRQTNDQSVNACRALAQLLQRSGCRQLEARVSQRRERPQVKTRSKY
jgi:hypothetical protein